MKKLQLALLIATVQGLLACSTVEGVGKDLQNLGKSIEKTAGPSTPVKPSPSNSPQPVEQPAGAVVTPIN